MMEDRKKELDLRRILYAARKFWWLYALAFIVIMGTACYYVSVKMPRYEATSSFLIEDSSSSDAMKSSGLMPMMRTFNVGGFGNTSVDNEIFLVTSRDIMLRTVREMKMNRIYTTRIDGKKTLLYPETPVTVDAPAEFFDTLSVGFKIDVNLLGNGLADIKAYKGRFFKKDIGSADNVTLPHVLSTVYGPIAVSPSEYYDKTGKINVTVTVMGNELAAADMERIIVVDVPNKLAEGISLSYYGGNRAYARDVLNALMRCYNEKRLERKHSTAAEEVQFYDNRINAIFSELSDAEKKVEKFKSDNKLYGIEQESSMLIGSSFSQTINIAEAEAAMDYYKSVKATLSDPDKRNSLIPVKERLGNPTIELYNRMVLKRNALERSAKSDNPALVALNRDIEETRKSVLDNIESLLLQSQLNIDMMRGIVGSSRHRLDKMPAYEREYTDLIRDKNLKNELYLFLLEKRESAALAMTSTSTLGFIVDPAYSELKPNRKKEIIVLALGLFLSLAGPSFLIFLFLGRDCKVNSVADMLFFGSDSRVSASDDISKITAQMRTPLLTLPHGSAVFVDNLAGDTTLIDSLTASLREIGRSVSVIDSLKENDALLTFDYSSLSDDITFITVPDPESFKTAGDIMKSPGSTLLILIRKNHTLRSFLRKLVRQLPASKVLIAMLP